MIRDLTFRLFRRLFRALFGTRLAAAIWHIPGSRQLYRALMERLAPKTVTVDGHTMHLDETDSLLLSVNGTYEPFERTLFEACVRAEDVIVDIGAHIGLYTLAAARAVGPSGRILAFEPMHENFELLLRNIRANGYSNVTTVKAAVADSSGTASLLLSPDNTGDNSLVRDSTGARKVEQVETITLDAYADELGHRVDVIKMDIQGGEPRALAGARALLSECPDIILFTEVSPLHLGGRDGAEAYADALTLQGFELFTIDEATRSVAPTTAEGVWDASLAASHDGHVNLVCIKGASARHRLEACTTI